MAETDSELIDRLAKGHSVSAAAVQVVMSALRSGGGRMAQFSHADFGGMSQWSPGLVGDKGGELQIERHCFAQGR
jgi:hypothetical protein